MGKIVITLIKPYQLLKGDTIGILSPSFVLKHEDIQPSLEKLKEKGFKIKIANNAFKDTYGYAATPEERAEDFNGMIADNDVKMLLFGGGEVCNEILPLLDFSLRRENPKIICSYSDSTTLLNAIAVNSGVVTFYGQSLRTFLNITDYNYQCFQSAFCSSDIPVYCSNSKWEIIREGKCEGALIGGYLVDAEYERLKALGVEFVKLPKTHPWGSRSFWFRDLDGNIVDFVCVPTT